MKKNNKDSEKGKKKILFQKDKSFVAENNFEIIVSNQSTFLCATLANI